MILWSDLSQRVKRLMFASCILILATPLSPIVGGVGAVLFMTVWVWLFWAQISAFLSNRRQRRS